MELSFETLVVGWGITLALVATAAWLILRGRRREQAERARMHAAAAAGLHLPASLHPVIDTDLCISSQACVASCPQGDVLGVVGGAGRLVHGAACIGHGRCAIECPVGAIRLVFGTSERGQDIPFVTPAFESSRTGVYVAGELGGMGLIRNAVLQGVAAAQDALQRLEGPAPVDGVDVAIVGAGPAGLGAALACVEAGARYALLEQEAGLGGTVAHFPRQKLILTEPIDVPLFGRIHRAEMTKEELLRLWQDVVAETGLQLRPSTRVERFEGDDGNFTLHTAGGTLRARKIVLAIGRRGSPRKLGVPGEEQPHVAYHLIEPEQYARQRVAVVGGGDSALEAACALVEHGAQVALCYRGENFFRAKVPNRERVERLAAQGRLDVLLRTEVAEVRPGALVLGGSSEERPLPADYVIAALGGELPAGFLQQHGIRIDRWFGQPPRASAPGLHLHLRAHVDAGPWLAFGLAALGLALVTALAWVGRDYYLLDALAREASPAHARLRSSGSWGHGIGIMATAIMLTNFAYAARKRLAALRGRGAIQRWLTVHALVGLFTPAVIAFHAAFQSKNLIALATYLALGAVVSTGIVGRSLYGRIRASEGFDAAARTALLFKRLLRAWRVLHVSLALLMVLTIAVHVGVSVLLGYRWLF